MAFLMPLPAILTIHQWNFLVLELDGDFGIRGTQEVQSLPSPPDKRRKKLRELLSRPSACQDFPSEGCY